MITFYNDLPESIIYDGKKYRLTPTHHNVLRMYDSIKGMDDEAQIEIMLHYLVKGDHPLSVGLLEAIQKILFPDTSHGKKVFDFIQDSSLIYAAFMQAYRIDLVDTPLHWWKFQSLMEGLPSNTRFAEVVQIRAMDVPKPTKYNSEERGRIIRLKQEYALKISAEEREQNLQNGLRRMLEVLMARANNG